MLELTPGRAGVVVDLAFTLVGLETLGRLEDRFLSFEAAPASVERRSADVDDLWPVDLARADGARDTRFAGPAAIGLLFSVPSAIGIFFVSSIEEVEGLDL